MNELFPGRPDYTGPTSGVFFAVHHSVLAEPSDNIMERVEYITSNKPKKEIAIRLHNLMYLGQVGEDYEAKRAPLDADYQAKHASLDADYEAKRAPLDADVLTYVLQHIPDCA